MKQSEKLTNFYKAYLDWLDAGAVTDEFSRGSGLCHNLDRYYDWNSPDTVEEMVFQFKLAWLDEYFPFNEGSHMRFVEEIDAKQSFINPARIRWVRNHIQGV